MSADRSHAPGIPRRAGPDGPDGPEGARATRTPPLTPDGLATRPRSEGDPVVVPLYFDFASSLCHVAHRVMGRMTPVLEELDLRILWIPIDLAALLNRRRGHPMSPERRRHVRAVADGLDVDLAIPTHWLESRPLGAALLQQHALDEASGTRAEPTLRERVFTRIFEQARPCLSHAESLELLAELGLATDDAALEPALDALEAWTRLASQQMVTGVPTFMLGPWPLGGIQEDRTMESIFRRWVAKLRSPATR